jgi:hypothetical protein
MVRKGVFPVNAGIVIVTVAGWSPAVMTKYTGRSKWVVEFRESKSGATNQNSVSCACILPGLSAAQRIRRRRHKRPAYRFDFVTLFCNCVRREGKRNVFILFIFLIVGYLVI